MIAPPAGWRQDVAGDKLKLTSPGGVAAGAISYVERLRPIRSVPELIRSGPPPPGFAVAKIGAIREVVTHEGEYGALCDVEGRIGDAPALLAFGFVFLDDYYAAVRGVALEPSAFDRLRATVAELVASDAHLLGRVRRRRFRYAAPPGWIERRRLFESRWSAPGPDDGRTLAVGPALPKQPGLADAILGGVLDGAEPARAVRAPRRSVSTARGLHGHHWHLGLGTAGAPLETHLVILEDEAFVYGVRLDARPPGPGGVEVLDELVESIAPIPAPAARPGSAGVLRHWAD